MKNFKFLVASFLLILILQYIPIQDESGSIIRNEYSIGSSSVEPSGLESCTTISISIGDKVFYGVNEASWPGNPFVAFTTGDVLFGSFDDFGNIMGVGGLMNSRGFFGDENRLPDLPMNIDPLKENMSDANVMDFFDNFTIVGEFVASIDNFNLQMWGDNDIFMGQLHFSDMYGTSVVISGNLDGETVYTYKKNTSNYLLSMNFNLAYQLNSYHNLPCPIYNTAVEMLDEIKTEEDLTVEAIRDVLNAVHVEGDIFETKLTYILDPVNMEVFIYYNHDYDIVFHYDFAEEIDGMAPDGMTIYNIGELYDEILLSRRISNSSVFIWIAIPVALLIRQIAVFVVKRKELKHSPIENRSKNWQDFP